MSKKKVVALTGAGISAESGIKTFRDANGLWEGHDVMQVASPQGWERDPELVLDFYNQRRKQLREVHPNAAHQTLATLEEQYDVHIITQNVDDLHERAGSSQVLHLHGELLKVRSTGYPHIVYRWEKDLMIGDCCERGSQLRPHIVWFGEMVPNIPIAQELVSRADAVIIVGTSLQVYPAAGLVGYAPGKVPIFYIDPKPARSYELDGLEDVFVIAENASTGVKKVVEALSKVW